MSQDRQQHQTLLSVPLWAKLTAGATAAGVESFLTYPLDVMKTRAQLASTYSNSTGFKHTLLNEGPSIFYRGLPAAMAGEAMKKVIRLGGTIHIESTLFPPDKPRYDRNTLSNKSKTKIAAFCGALSGFIEAFFTCPFDVVKTRMQAHGNKAIYTSTFNCLNKILHYEGLFKGLYIGLEAQIWRNMVWNSIYYSSLGNIKQYILPQHQQQDKQQIMLVSMLSGFISGSLASICNNMFDVAKTRIQAETIGGTETVKNTETGLVTQTIIANKKYNYTIPTLYKVVSQEGAKALFKGLGPRLARLSLSGGIMSLIYDSTLEHLLAGPPGSTRHSARY